MRCHFRSWHFSVVADLTDDVGSWGESGLTADIAETTRMTQLRHRLHPAQSFQ
jgi:hypothetical protein